MRFFFISDKESSKFGGCINQIWEKGKKAKSKISIKPTFSKDACCEPIDDGRFSCCEEAPLGGGNGNLGADRFGGTGPGKAA
jgi:hypothetical protein